MSTNVRDRSRRVALFVALTMLGAGVVFATAGRIAARSRSSPAAEETNGAAVPRDIIQGALDHSIHQSPAIDGAERADLIPDDVAYRILLNSLKGTTGMAAAKHRHARARRAFTSDICHLGHAGAGSDIEIDSWASTLIGQADAYHAQLSRLDATAAATTRSQRERLVQDISMSLQVSLTPEAWELLECYVTKEVKQKVRYFD